jgi:hypothetical protein
MKPTFSIVRFSWCCHNSFLFAKVYYLALAHFLYQIIGFWTIGVILYWKNVPTEHYNCGFLYTEHHSWVVNTSASYLGGPGFSSWPRDGLSWFSTIPSDKCWGSNLKLSCYFLTNETSIRQYKKLHKHLNVGNIAVTRTINLYTDYRFKYHGFLCV